MPVSKAELARALALLKELLIHAENNDGMDSSVLEPLELASETIGSELFSKLVDAQNSQSKNNATLPNEDWSGGVKLLPAEYSDHFSVSDDSDCVCSQLQSDSPTKPVSIDLNAVLEEELSPASILPSSKLLHNDFHQQAQEIDPSLLSTAVNTKLLQNDSKPNTVSDDLEQKIVKEEVNSPSSIEHASTEDQIKSEGVTQRNVADLLSPMRDGKSLLDIKQALRGKHGRDIRYVPLVQSFEKFGMELVGLRKTGTYIASLSDDCIAGMSGLLQVGDQILEVNGTICDDVASFEIAHQIEDVPMDKEIVLGVIYNPTGLKEFQRLSKRSYTK